MSNYAWPLLKVVGPLRSSSFFGSALKAFAVALTADVAALLT